MGKQGQKQIAFLKRLQNFSWPLSLGRDVLVGQKTVESILIKVFLYSSSRFLDIRCVAYERVHILQAQRVSLNGCIGFENRIRLIPLNKKIKYIDQFDRIMTYVQSIVFVVCCLDFSVFISLAF